MPCVVEGFGAMIITHYQRLFETIITPDVVHVMMEEDVLSFQVVQNWLHV